MEFALTPEQAMLTETVRQFIERELAPLAAQVETNGRLDQEDAQRIFANSKALGLYAMNAPLELGGGGLTAVEWMLVEEQFGRTSDILIRRAFGNVYEMLHEGTPEQIERWLKPAISGERTGSVAFTEPEAGSDAAAVRSHAVRAGEGWVINGYKHFISDAHHSDYFIITVVTDGDAGPNGISAFIVDKGTPGFTIGANQEMMGLRGTTHAELFLDNVRVGPEHLLGREGQGLKLALSTLGRVRLAQVGARAIGKAARMLELMVAHARERKQFGRPIGDFQMIQKMLADSAIEIASARLLLLYTAWTIDQGRDARGQISMVKVQASETLGRVADRAVRIFGGSGYAKGLPVERLYRDARIFRIFDGTSEIHRSVIARSLMGGSDHLFQLAV